jgi:hypothetical protein
MRRIQQQDEKSDFEKVPNARGQEVGTAERLPEENTTRFPQFSKH